MAITLKYFCPTSSPVARTKRECGEEMGKTEREKREAGAEWFASYLQDIRATGHRDSYDSSPFSDPAGCFARPSRCFCSVLPVALFLFRGPVAPLPPRDRSSAFFFHGFFLLPPRSPTAGFDTNSAPDLLPLFPQCARAPLFFQIHVSLVLSRSASLRPFLPLPAPTSLSPAPVLPASSYTSPGSRLLLLSFSSRRAGLFAGAEASPGLLENGETGRTGTRTRTGEDEDERMRRRRSLA